MQDTSTTFGRTVALGAGLLVCAAVLVTAQDARQALPGKAAAKAIVQSTTVKGFVPPKTPWGDPDLQGVFTTKDEANTPFERPPEWKGRRMEDITPQEFAEAISKRQQDAIESAPFAGGGEPEEGVAIAVPIHWFDNLAAMNSRPWFVIDPVEGAVPPMIKKDVARGPRAFGPAGGGRDSYTDRSLNDRCIAMTWRQPTLYGNSYQILQTKDYVVLRREQIHEARIIPLDGRAHVGEGVRTYEGDARGHWDGNTLVVETTNFTSNVPYRAGVRGGFGAATPGPKARVIERFTRTAPNKVEWTVTFDDADTWARDWSYSFPLTGDETQAIFEYACHEGNFAVANILSAGRTADKKHEKK